MNFSKSHFVSIASGFLVVSEAASADLPVKAKAVEYVKVCSVYGAGFFYIPGTDVCIKLGGYQRIDTTFNGAVYALPAYFGDLGQGNRYRDYFVGRSRLGLTVDTRTATEYGVVRTFGSFDIQFNNYGTSNPLNALTFPGGASNALNIPDGGYVPVGALFIQFAGFTFGKSASAYASPWHGYLGNNTSYLMGGHDTVTGVDNIKYTQQFGKGVSATIGLDDPTVYNRTTLLNMGSAGGLAIAGFPASVATAGGVAAYGGTHVPDIVGNMRVDQSWGLFQISGALHAVNASYNVLSAGGVPTALSENSGHPDTKWGGAAMATLQIKNIPTGTNDDIKMDVSYAKGNTKNVISTSGTSPSFLMFGSTSRAGAYQSLGFGQTSDAVFSPNFPGSGIMLTTAYGMRGAFNHNWDPYWSSSLFGSYSAVRYSGSQFDSTTAKGQFCASFKVGKSGFSADYSCNPDFNVSQLGVVTRWTPIKNLAFSAEVQWFHLDQKFTGAAVVTLPAPKPTTAYEFKDQSTVSLNIRVQRNF